jgi:hypothetical protein
VPLAGALFRRLPVGEIPTTRAKTWVVVAAGLAAVLVMALVIR